MAAQRHPPVSGWRRLRRAEALAIGGVMLLYVLVSGYFLMQFFAVAPLLLDLIGALAWILVSLLFVRQLLRDRLLVAMAVAAAFVIAAVIAGLALRQP
jgi:hypothetical protein